MELGKILDFTPTPCRARQTILNDPARLLIACAGRSGGKWIYCGAEFVNRTLDRHPLCSEPIYAYCYPTRDQAHRVVWPKLTRMYRKAGAVLKVNESEMRIDLRNGAHVFCAGLDKPERIEGQHYCGIAVDEASDTKPEAILTSIFPALNAYKGWLFLLGVPKRNGIGGAFYREMCEKTQANPDDVEGFKASYHYWTSEEIYSREQLEMFRKKMAPKDYNEQFLAKWENNAGMVYYAFDRVESVFGGNEYRPDLPLLVSSDFNVSPMSWVVCQYDGQRLRVIDEISLRDTNTHKTLDELWNRWGHHQSGFQFFGDAAGQQRHTSAAVSDYIQIYNDKRFANRRNNKVSILYMKANPKVVDRVASVNAMLLNAAGERRLLISNRCEELLKDFEAITWKEGGEREMDKSNSDRTHMSDALGYLVHTRFPMLLDRERTGMAINTREF